LFQIWPPHVSHSIMNKLIPQFHLVRSCFCVLAVRITDRVIYRCWNHQPTSHSILDQPFHSFCCTKVYFDPCLLF
jgi:hypothetical protein